MTFTYKGSEALDMLKTTFPKSWEEQITDGQVFIRSLMKMYQLTPVQAYQKFLKQTQSVEKAISTLASLYVMDCQEKIGTEIAECRKQQLAYGNQLTALEASGTSPEDKKTLRSYYLSKQNELQQRIENLIFDYPIIGAKRVIVQANLFEN